MTTHKFLKLDMYKKYFKHLSHVEIFNNFSVLIMQLLNQQNNKDLITMLLCLDLLQNIFNLMILRLKRATELPWYHAIVQWTHKTVTFVHYSNKPSFANADEKCHHIEAFEGCPFIKLLMNVTLDIILLKYSLNLSFTLLFWIHKCYLTTMVQW